MAKLVDIFIQPSTVFAQERERPTFILPWLLLSSLAVVLTLSYFMRVDGSWLVDHMLATKAGGMTAKEMAQARAMMPGAHTMGMLGALAGPITVGLMFAVIGLYYWLASKVTGAPFGYKHGLSLIAWSAMPGVLGSVVAIVGALTMAPQTSLESLMLTHVDPLLVDSTGSHWHRLAQNIDLLSLWSIFLTALGWRVFTRGSWVQGIVVAVLPYLVVFGVMALLPG